MKKLIQVVVLGMLGATVLFGQTITAVRIPNAVADAGGTGTVGYPYAVFVQISGWTSLANLQAYVKLYSGSNNEYMWSATGVWSNTTTYASSNQPLVNIDANGNWSGWIYAKHNASITASPSLRAAKVGTSATNLTSAQIFTFLNMATTGGFLVATSSSAVNKPVVAFSAGKMVGSYRTEDNGIAEGYSYSAGGFQIAVPIGLIDSLVFYNDDGSRYSSMVGPWSITPGNLTDAGTVIAVSSGAASLSPSLWKYSTPTTVQMVFKRSSDTVCHVRMLRPTNLTWNTGSITVSPLGAIVAVNADSIQIDNLALNSASDSLVVSLGSVTAADTTGSISMIVRSSKDGITFGQIAQSPSMMIYGSPRAMSQVKAKNSSGVPVLTGKYVVVQGVVTVANEFGGPAYVQDATAGISVYDSSVSQNVNRGDEVELLGVVSPYQNMFELNPCSLLQVMSQGNPVDTATLTIASINGQVQNGVEPYECRLIRVNNITSVLTSAKSPTTTWGTTGVASALYLISGIDTLQTYIKANNNLSNTSTPSGKFDVVGVLGQYYSAYQILPRTYSDIIVEGTGPRITSGAPIESNMTASSMKISWQTDSPGSSIVIRGMTTAYTDTLVDTNQITNHQLVLNGLLPATIYHIKLGSENSAGTTYTNDYIVSTASQTSKGTMNVYFNHSVNTALANGENAQNVDISSKIINRISAAKYSVDAALYSFSGTVGTSVAAALVAAKNRGVAVRMIGEADNLNTGTPPWSAFNANGIPNIVDTYDAVNAGAGLMHDKFFVIDVQDPASDTTSWVITGSWNSTDDGNINDAQNVIEIQDKALANAYTIEFNEMWGSSTATPSAANSRFGARKLDNTPHYFIIQGTPVELYFSPSDGTTSKIIKTLTKAVYNVNFCLLTLTRNDIANVLIAKEKAGLHIHGVMSNKTDQGSVFDALKNSGVDVYLKNNSDVSGFLHHKYGIVDAGTNAPAQYVITGSHNWTSSAENVNNENALIINSPRLANLYLQEFSNRYTAAGGSDVLLGVKEVQKNIPQFYDLSQNYPNPFNPTTNIQFQIPISGLVSIKVFDILGREVAILMNEVKSVGIYQITWNASTLPSGVYFYRVQTGTSTSVKKAMLLK
ncbi:MAG: phospholipase D-like domain-containing protein [Bacteroidota bacterium]